MPLGMIFWMLMIIWLIFGVVNTDWTGGWRAGSGNLLLFVLLGLLGWAEFGSVIK
jgi:hypothetical protein